MERIGYLIIKKLKGNLSSEEERELELWMLESANHRRLAERLSNPKHLAEEYARENRIDWQRPMEDMQRRVSKIRRRSFFRKATPVAAAILLIALVTSAVMLIPNLGKTTKEDILAETLELGDLIPGKTGAIYRGTNGRTMILSASDTSILANQIEIDGKKSKDGEWVNLSLEVGRGREFKIVLEDSTVVWLNSESTLCYPERFAAESRRVSVTGEAYFEVHHERNRPFIVDTGGELIKVYGTTFNVRGYKDEEAILTTLETGKIAISDIQNKEAELFLYPGHQARFEKATGEVRMKEVDPEIVTGWRQGKFVFEETPLSTIMRDLSRWYDFQYEFEDEDLKNIIYMGSVSRYSDFRTIISILEDSGEVKFSLHSNKIVISRKQMKKAKVNIINNKHN